MADEKARIVVDGDVSPLRQKLREAARDIKQFGDEGRASIENIGGPLKMLQEKFLAIGALLAGGAVFRQAVEQAANFTEESIKLGNALGTSATEASTFISTLADIDVSQQEFVTATKALSKEIKNNEDGLQAMGLKTRDAAGHLRPLNQLVVEAVDVLNGYKAGTDRAIAGQMLFGKGFDITSNLTKLNSEALKENEELQRRLGILVGTENVEAWKAYDQASDQSNLTLKAMWVTIGNALMPVLTKLSDWFVAVGPYAITTIKGAIGGLIAAFWALKNGVVVVWETINAMVVTVAEPLRALAASLWKLTQGDFKGAWGEFGAAGQTMANAWKGALKEMETSSRETRDRILSLFTNGTQETVGGKGGKSAAGLVNEGKDKKKTGKQYTDSEWALEEQAWNADRERQFNDLRAEYHEAANRAIEAADRKLLKELDDIHAMRLDGSRNAELERIDALEAAARHEAEMGAVTQRDLLARLAQFNDMRLAEEERYIAAKREVAMEDPDQNAVALERLEQEKLEIRRRYGAQAADIQHQAALESQSIWRSLGDSMTGLWDKGVNAMMNGTLTWRNALRAIGAEMVQWFGVEVVGNQVKTWLAGQAKMLAIKMGFIAQENTAQAAGSAVTVATKIEEAGAVTAANAVEAGTGAAASQASIPIVGPVLALAAMAAIFAAVSGMGKKVKSASAGFDIPKGLNPMTQLHEEEMVLPAKYANVIRGLGSGDAGVAEADRPAPTVSVSITAMDSRDVHRALVRDGALSKALKTLGRNYAQ